MILDWIIVLLGIPFGFLIAWFARDELVYARNWFKWLGILSIVGSVAFCLSGFKEIGWTLGFLFLLFAIAYWKSFNKKWTKKS